jgi:hypothetical protein
MNSLVLKYIDKLKSPKVLVIIGIIGIMLIFISSLFSEKEEPKETGLDMGISSVEYREQLERDVEKLVTKITGSKNVTVIVTLESGMRYKYADIKEGSSEDKSEESIKLSSSESKQDYITIKQQTVANKHCLSLLRCLKSAELR